jgi:hypothetical protein
MEAIEKPKTNIRSLNVMIMLFSFLMLPWSGILIHKTHGMEERELIRHLAMTVHNVSAIIFLTSCILHIIANRKALVRNIYTKTKEYGQFKREALIALAIVIGIIGFISMHVFHVR